MEVRGAYSIVILSRDGIFAARDPNGIRPLSLGIREGSPVVASETCAFDLIGAKFERDVEPGEIVKLSREGFSSHRFAFPLSTPCVFEHVYFARPDSNVFGRKRRRLAPGVRQAARPRAPGKADVVIPVPDSGMYAALGYAEESGIPFAMGLVRNHYVGRTFIEPKQAIRHFGVKVKLNPVREVVEGKRVVMVDDSIVRGTTSRKIVRMLREAARRRSTSGSRRRRP
jgi:amidophosphoribosyltransferase